MRYIARVERANDIAIVTGDDKKEVMKLAIKLAKEDIKKRIHEAVWLREIDQISTREVSDKFGCSLATARSILLNIVNGKSGDSRFQPNTERGEGVLVKDGYTFNYSPMDMNEGGMSKNAPKHYIWFCD